MFEKWEDFPSIVTNDFLQIFCGDLLGDGISRQVYQCTIDKTLVIKVEHARTFQNVIEWDVWDCVKDTEFSKYFAPCISISQGGHVLLMKKTSPMKKYPEKIPAFLTDTKRANYGQYKGQFCCHDYGNNLLIEKGLTKRLVKANWW